MMSRASCQKSVSALTEKVADISDTNRPVGVSGGAGSRCGRMSTGQDRKKGVASEPDCNWRCASSCAAHRAPWTVVPCARAAASRTSGVLGCQTQADEPGRSFCGLAGQPGDGGQRPVAPVVGDQGGLESPGRIGLLGPAVPGGVHLGHGGQGARASARARLFLARHHGQQAAQQRCARTAVGDGMVKTQRQHRARGRAFAGTGSASAGPLLPAKGSDSCCSMMCCQ